MLKAKHEKPLPKSVYVCWEDDGDGSSFLVAHESTDVIEQDVRVGLYQLHETRTKRVTHSLE